MMSGLRAKAPWRCERKERKGKERKRERSVLRRGSRRSGEGGIEEEKGGGEGERSVPWE